MFGIGFGEIILIALIIFLICPKDIPKIFKKAGQLFSHFDKLKEEIFDIKKEFRDSISDEVREVKSITRIKKTKKR